LDCGRLDRSDHRLVAGEMEKSLGQTIVIINQPGASGSIGTRSALEGTKDGYTWTPARRRISAPGTLRDKFLVNYPLMPGLFGRKLCAKSGQRIFEIMYALAIAEEARAAEASFALRDMTASAPVRQRA
jgi:hypothetical protein